MDEVAIYEEGIEAILDLYRDDPEVAHSDEDSLLEAFVREQAEAGNWKAARLLRLFDNDREYSKWYA